MKISREIKSFMNKKTWYYIAVALIFTFAIAVRTFLFISNNSFEDDECRLILTIIDKNIWQVFLPLGDAQSAPPLFLVTAKFLTYIFGYKEYILKFIPFACSIASLFVFYKITTLYFEKKISVLIALLIFVLVRPFMAFSATFKQYSSDVLICLLCLYSLPRFNIASLTLRRTITTAVTISLIPFISLPSVFFIGSWIIQNLVINFKNKNFYKRLTIISLPLIIFMIFYYIFNLLPSKDNLLMFFPKYWDHGFFNISLKSFLTLIKFNLLYNFFPNNLPLFQLLLLAWGIYLSIKDGAAKNTVTKYITLTLSLVLLASLLHLYPFAGRVALYFIPCLIILIVKPLDYYKTKTIAFGLAVLLLALGFYRYNSTYLTKIFDKEFFYAHSPKNLMLILKENFNPKEDVILCNDASASSYLFYSSIQHFETDAVYLIPGCNAQKECILKYLEGLNKDTKIWLYLIKDYSKAEIFPYIFEWLSNKDILYYKKEQDSYLIYFQN